MPPVALQMLSAYVLSQIPFRRSAPGKQSPPDAVLRSELARSCLFAALAALFILPGYGRALPLILAVFCLRLALGWLSVRFFWRSWQGLVALEALQLAAAAWLCSVFSGATVLGWALAALQSSRLHAAILAYTLSLGLGSALVPLVTARLQPEGSENEGIKGAGTCIGILERLLVTSMIIFWPELDAAAIGLVFSAKSIARFPEFRKAHFAEYFLVGSLTSFIVAIGAGLIARSML